MTTIEQELARLDSEIGRLTMIRDHLRSLNGTPTPPRRSRQAATGKTTVAEAAERILRKHGEPIRTRDLLPQVQAAGARCRDTETLAKTLGRHDRFKKAGRGLWTLA